MLINIAESKLISAILIIYLNKVRFSRKNVWKVTLRNISKNYSERALRNCKETGDIGFWSNVKEKAFMRVRFKISDEIFSDNCTVILKLLSHIKKVRNALPQEETDSMIKRQSKYKILYEGKALRKYLNTGVISSETYAENENFFHISIERVSFLIYNKKLNTLLSTIKTPIWSINFVIEKI